MTVTLRLVRVHTEAQKAARFRNIGQGGRILGVVVAGLMVFAGIQMAGAQGRGAQWVSAWQGSPTPGGTFYSPGCPSDVGLNGQTVRNIVFLSAGGNWVRARISNAGGSLPLAVGSA